MIVETLEGDIFQTHCQTAVCPVNTVGKMGAGLALAFKRKFPQMEPFYQEACYKDVFRREGILIYNIEEPQTHIQKILCMPTKRHWRLPSKIEWIDESLQIIARVWKEAGISSLAIPAVGCGNGKLDWADIEEVIHQRLDHLELPVTVYRPSGYSSEHDEFGPERGIYAQV